MDRHAVLDRLNAARAELLLGIKGLDETTMTTLPIAGTWTIKEVLAHLSGWESWHLAAIRQALAGTAPDFSPLQDRDSFNRRLLEERRGWTVTEILDELDSNRTALEELLLEMPEESLFRAGPMRGPQWENLAGWLRVAREHEEEHAAHIRAWRRAVTMI
jgi:hypothetical protein